MPPRARLRAELPASVGETRSRATPELLTAIERKRMVPVPWAAEFNSLSVDTFKRKYPHLIKRVSEKRLAVELGDVLDIPKSIDDA
jgi:hypothetical protein